jgi:hypothetical protein
VRRGGVKVARSDKPGIGKDTDFDHPGTIATLGTVRKEEGKPNEPGTVGEEESTDRIRRLATKKRDQWQGSK